MSRKVVYRSRYRGTAVVVSATPEAAKEAVSRRVIKGVRRAVERAVSADKRKQLLAKRRFKHAAKCKRLRRMIEWYVRAYAGLERRLDAEDLKQEAWILLHRVCLRIDPRTKPLAFRKYFRIALRRRLRDLSGHHRRKRRDTRREISLEVLSDRNPELADYSLFGDVARLVEQRDVVAKLFVSVLDTGHTDLRRVFCTILADLEWQGSPSTLYRQRDVLARMVQTLTSEPSREGNAP